MCNHSNKHPNIENTTNNAQNSAWFFNVATSINEMKQEQEEDKNELIQGTTSIDLNSFWIIIFTSLVEVELNRKWLEIIELIK